MSPQKPSAQGPAHDQSVDSWSIVETAFGVDSAKAWEGMFTLGSGYLHVRGSLEEHLANAPQNVAYMRLPANVTSERFPETKVKWGTYVPGIFGRHPLLNNEMINLPWFLGLIPVVDGERLDLETSRVEAYRRELRMDTATLQRTVTWRTRSGRQVEVHLERFVSGASPQLCVQRLRLVSDGPVEVQISGGIDADVLTNGYNHFVETDLTARGSQGVACRVVTDRGDRIEIVSELHGPGPGDYRATDRAAQRVICAALAAGQELIVEKRSAVSTSRDLGRSDAAAVLSAAADQTWAQLHAAHVSDWQRRWKRCDVVVDGDESAQQAIRFALYHLLRAQVPGDSRVAIDPKGYAGEAYWGRYFWDTEMFLLPFYLYTDPSRARTLVNFRVHSLPGARDNAARYGYPGARYAWESDADGHECCPNWQYGDHEVHVTADVVHGLVHYAAATGEGAFISGPAAAVIIETARYWMARLDWRQDDDGPSLLGVMGPDEYTPISSNNAFTNAIVAFALHTASAIGPEVGVLEEECAQFAEAADGLSVLLGEDGVLVLQCEEFEALAEPRFAELWPNRTRTFGAQVSQERLYRSKCLKQADVLMLMWLFPEHFTTAQVQRAWDYYLPYTTHDSSLSPGVHAIVAARLGLHEQAWSFWKMGEGIDLDPERGGAAEGIHIANAGAVWQMAVCGFGGLYTALQADVLTLQPRLPAQWTRLAFPLIWQGVPVEVTVSRTGATVRNRGAQPLTVQVHGVERTVQPGEVGEWTEGAQ